MPPAARITDMHVCPMVSGVVPHVGGPVAKGEPTVLIGGMPAARATDMCTCVGPPDPIAKGAATVLIGGLPAARMGDPTMHGGSIVAGLPTVMIDDVTPGGGAPPSSGGGGGAESGGGSDGAGGASGGGSGSSGQAQAVIVAVNQSGAAAVESAPAGHAGPLESDDHDAKPKTWIGIVLRDFDETPIPNQRFKVTLEGGQTLAGVTDENGYCRFDEVDPDQGEVDFIQITDNDDIALDKHDDEAPAREDDTATPGGGAPPSDHAGEVTMVGVVDHAGPPDDGDEDAEELLT
jgi:uncharacterized Zn-binding protein involved in type VI secretion